MEPRNLEYFENLFESILVEQKSTPDQWNWTNEGRDEGDLSCEEEVLSLDLRLRSRDTVYFKKIKDAMGRIKDGTFGNCKDCGCDIGVSRLRARPTAELCIHCKEEQEREETFLMNNNRYSTRVTRMPVGISLVG